MLTSRAGNTDDHHLPAIKETFQGTKHHPPYLNCLTSLFSYVEDKNEVFRTAKSLHVTVDEERASISLG
jgi:hypothetical protein